MKLVDEAFRFLLCLVLLIELVSGQTRAEDKTSSDLNVGQVGLAAKYSIQVVPAKKTFRVPSARGTIIGGAPSDANFSAVFRVVQQEMALYPKRLVEQTGLRQIVLCDCLTYDGKALGGFAYLERCEIYIDVTEARHDELWARAAIHHEFFHLIDSKLPASFRSNNWASLNPPTFKYRCRGAGASGLDALCENYDNVLGDTYPGFVNSYSTSHEWEDRAEVFAHLIVYSSDLSRKMSEDGVLQAKVAWIKDVVAKWCPETNGKFWEKAQKLKRPPGGRPVVSEEAPPRRWVEPGEAKGPGL
jgi:hypothetical protein